MEDTIVSTNVASERHEGTLVFLKVSIRFLSDSRPLSISLFTTRLSGKEIGLHCQMMMG